MYKAVKGWCFKADMRAGAEADVNKGTIGTRKETLAKK
jgi:hypothetical protein